MSIIKLRFSRLLFRFNNLAKINLWLTFFPQKLLQIFHTISIEKFGLYAISIRARCQGKRFFGFKKEQNLRVKINGTQFREIPPEKNMQLFNIPPAWNGTEIRGLSKTVVFVLPLNVEDYTFNFFAESEALIEKFEYKLLPDLHHVNFDLNEQAEDGNTRPWYTFAFINMPLLSIKAAISTQWHFLDGDDVKLIIDNNVEQNSESEKHHDWLWSAKAKLFSEPKREEKTFDKNLQSGIHYIEFWADKTPTLHQAQFDLGDFQPKRIPTVKDPEWTDDFNDDTGQMLLARLILGEAENQSKETKIWVGGAVLNRVKAKAWPNTIHEVILQKGQYDPFKPENINFPKVTDPLNEDKSKLRLRNWQDCYEIAQKLLSEEMINPTTATHFHGIGVTKEWFIEHLVPQGKFLKQINDTYFYWSPN